LIRCNQSNNQQVLVLKSPQLPDGISAIGLLNGTKVVFKVPAQMYQDDNGLLSLMETPATPTSKEAKLNTQTKTAKLIQFHLSDPAEGAAFICQN
jgi:hypothetical protein